jgi:hypothetical protein
MRQSCSVLEQRGKLRSGSLRVVSMTTAVSPRSHIFNTVSPVGDKLYAKLFTPSPRPNAVALSPSSEAFYGSPPFQFPVAGRSCFSCSGSLVSELSNLRNARAR